MAETLKLPVIDLSSTDRISTAKSIRRACVDFGFFYLVNHGVEEELFKRVFEESKNLFSLPLEEKMKLARKEQRGYTPFYAEKLDTSLNSRGDLKESFYIGPVEGSMTLTNLNQWPSEGNCRSSAILETHNGILPSDSPSAVNRGGGRDYAMRRQGLDTGSPIRSANPAQYWLIFEGALVVLATISWIGAG
ncbi:protein DOWNY MILDEW RESISTANCE 6-like isoform X1 [Macadamia integrifolia]|uniref:protein DOWNY MILDEW RESISTANCE 6-like isoform X1 n=1 Tax=Macadamia integrifolia TaxID=60698 RepID=UPI001C4FD34C|nr:protein DOWNY MILDEW RESISTANCE 6-like isoform X1 [Macadamia integrifolia]